MGEASFGLAVGSQISGKIVKYVEHGHCGRGLRTVAERAVESSLVPDFLMYLDFPV